MISITIFLNLLYNIFLRRKGLFQLCGFFNYYFQNPPPPAPTVVLAVFQEWFAILWPFQIIFKENIGKTLDFDDL